MTSYRGQVEALIAEADATPWSPECGAILGKAIALAEIGGEDQLAYAARMRLCSNASWLNDDDLTLSTFLICHQQHSGDPVKFPATPDDGAGDLYWMWKWIPALMVGNPDVSREDLEATMAEFAGVYREAGLPTKAITQRRLGLAHVLGQLADIPALVDELATQPDDDYSDCEACSPSSSGAALLSAGLESQALELLDIVLTNHLSCGDEPEEAMSLALLPLLHAGRQAEADAAQQACYQYSKDSPGKANNIARLIRFYVLTGHLERALTLVHRHLDWLTYSPFSLLTHRSLLIATGIACTAATEAGFGARPEPAADNPDLVKFLGEVIGGHTLATLGEASWRSAKALSDGFDARNGNHFYAADLATASTVHTELTEIPLTLPLEPAEAFRDLAMDGLFLGSTMFTLTPGLITKPDDPGEAAALVRNLKAGGRLDEAENVLKALPKDHPEIAAATLSSQPLAGWQETLVEGRRLAAAGDQSAALSHLATVLAQLRTFGTAELRCDTALEVASLAAGLGKPAEAYSAATFAVQLAKAERLSDLADRTIASAGVLVDADEPQTALELLGDLDPDELDPISRGRAAYTLARTEQANNDPSSAIDTYLDAAELFEAAGDPSMEIQSALAAASLMADRHDAQGSGGIAWEVLASLDQVGYDEILMARHRHTAVACVLDAETARPQASAAELQSAYDAGVRTIQAHLTDPEATEATTELSEALAKALARRDATDESETL